MIEVIYHHTGSIIAKETESFEGVGLLFGFRFLNRFKSSHSFNLRLIL